MLILFLKIKTWLIDHLHSRKMWLEVGPIILLMGLTLPILASQPGTVDHDAIRYMTWALNILEGRGYTDIDGTMVTVRPPLYPLLLAALFHLAGASIFTAVWITKIFGICFNLLITYAIGRRLYGRVTGLLAGILLNGTIGLATLYNEIKIDPIIIVFLNLSILFLITAYQEKKLPLAILAGFLLGITFLGKDTALLWLPLPLYLILVTPSFRTKQHIEMAYLIWLLFIFTLVPWWVWFYIQTGNIYMAGQITKSWGWMIKWFLLALPFLVFGLWLLRQAIFRRLSFLGRLPGWFYFGVGFISWAAISRLFLILLWWGWVQPLDRFVIAGIEFFQKTLVEHLEGFQFVPWAWLLIMILAISRKQEQQPDRALLFLGMTCIPIWLFISDFPDTSVGRFDEIRQMLALVSVSYLALARTITFSIETILNLIFILGRRRFLFEAVLTTSLLIGIAGSGLKQNISFMQSRNDDEPYHLRDQTVRNRMTPAVLNVTDWLEQNVPANSNILLISPLYHHSFYFLMLERFNFFQLPFLYKYNNLMVLDDEFCLAARPGGVSKAKPECVNKKFLYLVKIPDGPWANNYHMNFQDDLEQYLIEKKIDYIYIALKPNYFQLTLRYLTSLFSQNFSSLAFELRYKGRMGDLEFYIYKVHPEYLDHLDTPPLLLDYEYTWTHLISEARETLGDNDLYPLLKALGNREIRFIEENARNEIPNVYAHLGDIYRLHRQAEAAIRQYRAALALNYDQAQRYLSLAEEMHFDYPDLAGPLILAGDASWQLNQPTEAQQFYEKAISMPSIPTDLLSAAYNGLGKIKLTAGEIEAAIFYYKESLELIPVISTQKRIVQLQGLLAQQQNDLETALALQRTAAKLGQGDNFSGFYLEDEPEYPLYDLLKEPRVVEPSSNQNLVRDDIFVFNDVPQKVLFQHPPSKVTFSLKIPEKAHLRFSIALSPEVWQPGKGDGVEFQVHLQQESNARYKLLDKYIDPKNIETDRKRHTYDIDLASWANQTVTLIFTTEPGPNQDARYDWAGWVDLRVVQPGYYSFLSHFQEADIQSTSQDQVHLDWMVIDNQLRDVIFAHPPARVTYPVHVRPGSFLCFGMGMDPEVWLPEKGDGVQYDILVQGDGKDSIIFSHYLNPKNMPDEQVWVDQCIDLSKFANEDISLSFITSPGLKNDTGYDWSGWSNPILLVRPSLTY